MDSNNQSQPDGCPVDHETRQRFLEQKRKEAEAEAAAAARNGCPVDHETQKRYLEQQRAQSEEIDPRNQMPVLNQQPAPGQQKPLSTERMTSSIPKAGTENDHWQYPSQQMFFNALIRNGKLGDATEDDMPAVIAIHNSTNELAWYKVLEYEQHHFHECPTPKLKSFKGLSSDYSPRARFRMMLGGAAPFDRHDWVVDRCGKDVRYILDYYAVQTRNSSEDTLIVVRPAIFDSFSNAYDFARMKFDHARSTFNRVFGRTDNVE